MKADFLDAQERHWNDAEALFNTQRWANADHLYGLAAECGLKHLMMKFGMDVDPKTGSPKKSDDRVHANDLWPRYESYLNGKMEGIKYGLPMPDPFKDWHVSDRYAPQSDFDHARAQSHQAGAKVICELVKRYEEN